MSEAILLPQVCLTAKLFYQCFMIMMAHTMYETKANSRNLPFEDNPNFKQFFPPR